MPSSVKVDGPIRTPATVSVWCPRSPPHRGWGSV